MKNKNHQRVFMNPATKKEGISPVIATVLLVAMVIVIALIIFLWFKGIGGEVITKFGGKNIELVCGDVQFSSEYTNDKLFISNMGNVPIFGMKVKVEGGGSHTTYDMETELDSNWPDLGLNQGGTFSSGDISIKVGDAETLTLIPVLMGTSDKGERTYLCDEDQYGSLITIY